MAGTNAFVTRLNSTGSALIYSTYLGGGGSFIPWYDPGETQPPGDGANGLVIDSAGDAFVTGTTDGDFPVTPGAYLTAFPPWICDGENGCEPATLPFAAKLNPTGTALVYATYLNNGGNAIAVDNAGSAYTADTSSVTKLTADGSGLVYFAPLNGPVGYSIAIAVDGSGNAYLAGSAGAGLPVTPNAFQPALVGKTDAFLSELDATGSTLLYSTYLGGSGGAGACCLNLDDAGNVYLAGSAGVDFPVTPGALQTGISGTGDGFVAKLNLSSASTTTPTTTTLTGGINPQPFGMPDPFTATVTGNGGEPTGYVYFTVDGVYAARTTLSPSGTAVYKTSSLPLGTHNVEALYAGSPTFSVSNDTVTENVIATATPMISPSGGKYVGSVQVTLSDPTPGAKIYYTINGGALNASSPVYSEPITISSGYAVVRAFATLDGYSPTSVVEAAYSILAQSPAPIIAPASGSVPVGQAVTITDAEPTATIRYTTDGSTPSTTSNWYHGSLAVLGPETISSIAISTGQASSEVASIAYTVFTQAPTISPAPGKYVGPTAIMLSDVSPVPYATIHYTLDGSNPIATSPVYSGPVTISSGYVLVKAIATFSGYPPTAITEAAYTILPQNPTPMISPASGNYPVGQTITITDTDSAATIRYTTDGSTPGTKSPVYTKALVLSGAETVQAIATGTSNATSNVATATYTTQ
jgi:Chitobiase/beta-hexosaminidase C-terminal domain/Bacterial Ig-like domain (group 3)/Fn3 associated